MSLVNSMLTIIKDELAVYDEHKGFLRRLFGDDPSIKRLRKLCNDVLTMKNVIPDIDRENSLFLSLREIEKDNQHNLRLSGYTTNSTYSKVKKELFFFRKNNTSPQELTKLSKTLQVPYYDIHKTYEQMGYLLKEAPPSDLIAYVLKHPEVKEVRKKMELFYSSGFRNQFTQAQLRGIIEQLPLYQDPAVMQLFLRTPKEGLSVENIDELIEHGKQPNPLLAVIAFLNRLIFLFTCREEQSRPQRNAQPVQAEQNKAESDAQPIERKTPKKSIVVMPIKGNHIPLPHETRPSRLGLLLGCSYQPYNKVNVEEADLARIHSPK